MISQINDGVPGAGCKVKVRGDHALRRPQPAPPPTQGGGEKGWVYVRGALAGHLRAGWAPTSWGESSQGWR
eukprot:scaffold1124_cov361-Prasinococcus_capsulatus_cf.AAC.17